MSAYKNVAPVKFFRKSRGKTVPNNEKPITSKKTLMTNLLLKNYETNIAQEYRAYKQRKQAEALSSSKDRWARRRRFFINTIVWLARKLLSAMLFFVGLTVLLVWLDVFVA